MFLKPLVVFACCGLSAGWAAAQCYTLYDRDNRVVYQGRESPVDMSRPLHETVPALQPGGHLVLDNIGTCEEMREPALQTERRPLPLEAGPDTRRMGAAPGASRRQGAVITEMHNPPVRAVLRNGELTIENLRDH